MEQTQTQTQTQTDNNAMKEKDLTVLASTLLYILKTAGVGTVFALILLIGGWKIAERVITSHEKFLDQTLTSMNQQAILLNSLAIDQKQLSINQQSIRESQDVSLKILDKQTEILEKWPK